MYRVQALHSVDFVLNFFGDELPMLYLSYIPHLADSYKKDSHLFFQFNDIINVPFSSEAFVAGLVAFFLDNTLHLGEPATRKDRGYHWWDRFRSYGTDPRSHEFYSLPYQLNKFFPSV